VVKEILQCRLCDETVLDGDSGLCYNCNRGDI